VDPQLLDGLAEGVVVEAAALADDTLVFGDVVFVAVFLMRPASGQGAPHAAEHLALGVVAVEEEGVHLRVDQ
jgi:hypothetical protein